MQPIVSSVAQTYKSIPAQYRPMLGLFLTATVIASLWRPVTHDSYNPPTPIVTSGSQYITMSNTKNPSQDDINAAESLDQPTPADDIPLDEMDSVNNNNYVVASGDTFSGILTQFGIDNSDIILLSRQHKGLANLRIGQQLSWTFDNNGVLTSLTWYVSPREAKVYERNGDTFTERVEKKEGEWVDTVISGTINGSFIASARQAGLTSNEINDITKALQWQLDFKRIQQNDRFTAIISREVLDGVNASSSLVAVRLRSGNRDYYAIRASDGQFYDQNAGSLSRGFLRFPMLKPARVSSQFNPRRLNPVTKRISPHNGVDFAVPVGTPILATGDGEVVIAKYSGAAGNYIAIRHGRQYLTRYMHLSKILVKPGQRVKRGDRIALSGNTGRSTGPHLHYEFHVNNKPVNPLTVNLPRVEGLTGKDRAEYMELVKKIQPQLQLN